MAGPGEIVIAESTPQLVGSLFAYESLGPVELKGVPRPVTAWKVLGATEITTTERNCAIACVSLMFPLLAFLKTASLSGKGLARSCVMKQIGFVIAVLLLSLTVHKPALAVIGIPPTCVPDRCHVCYEQEVMPNGASRCVKCRFSAFKCSHPSRQGWPRPRRPSDERF